MANRNFDFSAIVKILKAQNAANFYNRQQQIVNTVSTTPAQVEIQPANPQTANYDADTVPTIRAGQQAYYFKNNPTTTILSPQSYLPNNQVYTILVFSTIGTTGWKAPPLTPGVAYLVVGGGGGGGNGYDTGGGGGGGAGMVITGTLSVVPGTYYTVTVGAGGNGNAGAGGAAGAGLASELSGSSVTYGVGGAGAKGNTAVTGANGSDNTGNGGGGGSNISGAAGAGGTGGSGIVIIAFYA